MSGATLRAAESGDEARLKALWREVFHDEDAVIDAFFDCLYAPEDALVAFIGGELAAAAYLLRGVRLCAPGGSRPAAYFYALATRPDCRGRGLGRAITRECMRICAQRGESFCLMPGEDSLRRWYAEIAGLRSFGTAREISVGAAATSEIELREIGAQVCAARRESLLSDTPHAALPEGFFRFQARLCALSGGALLSLRGLGGGEGLACLERYDETARLSELLWTGGEEAEAAAAAAAGYGAADCVYRAPGEGLETVMAAATEPEPPFWWGPVFD